MSCASVPGFTSELCAPRRIVPPRSEFASRFWIDAVAILPFADQRDHRVRRMAVELGAVGVRQAGLVARVFDRRDLHAQADAEVGNAVLARVLRRARSCPRRRARRSRRARARRRTWRAGATFSGVSVSESTYSMLTRAWLWMPAWRSASLSDLYESDRSMYLPHIAMRHLVLRVLEPRARGRPSASGRPAAWSAAAASCRSARPGPARAACAAPCRWCRRPTSRSRPHSGTLVNSEILSRSSSGMRRSARHSSASGWMPISRSFCTVCCVGLVFSSPAAAIHGT